MQPSHAGLRYRERLTFSVPCNWRQQISVNDEVTQLRAELAAQTQQLVRMTLEQAVRDGRMLAAGREQFHRRYGDRGTVEQAADWIASAPRPPKYTRAASGPTDPDTTGRPDSTLVRMTREYVRDNEVRHFQLTGERLTFDRAAQEVAREVARSNPGLLRSFVTMMGEAD